MKQQKKITVLVTIVVIGLITTSGWLLYNKYLERQFQQAVVHIVKQSLAESLPQELPKRFSSDSELQEKVMQVLLAASDVRILGHTAVEEGKELAQIEIETVAPEAFEDFINIIFEARNQQKDLSLQEMKVQLEKRTAPKNSWRKLHKNMVLVKKVGEWQEEVLH